MFDLFRYLNTPDVENGMSPLQLAIYDNSLSVVKALIGLDVSLEHLDNEANSVFHYAAKSSSDIILVNLSVYFNKHSDKLCENVTGFIKSEHCMFELS